MHMEKQLSLTVRWLRWGWQLSDRWKNTEGRTGSVIRNLLSVRNRFRVRDVTLRETTVPLHSQGVKDQPCPLWAQVHHQHLNNNVSSSYPTREVS